MGKGLLIIVVLLTSGALVLRAQDYPASPVDGPVVKSDSLDTRPKALPPGLMPYSMPTKMPALDALAPPEFETKEKRAARINLATLNSVMHSMENTLRWERLPKYTTGQKWLFWGLGLFLSNPYGFPQGYVPMANASFPFIYAKEPGMAPYDSPYSPDYFPQAIKLEYDFATGTYKQVMVDWKDYQKQLSARFPSFNNTAPIPKIAVTPVERMMNR